MFAENTKGTRSSHGRGSKLLEIDIDITDDAALVMMESRARNQVTKKKEEEEKLWENSIVPLADSITVVKMCPAKEKR